jgi:membrane glycosyltransferase
MLTLFGLTAVLLLAPKVLALVAHVASGDARRFGGRARLVASALIEFFHSLLLAPVRMLFHTQFVLAALTGWRLDWKSPPRDDASTPWREAVARHGVHTLLAIAWIAAIVATSEAFPWWLSPILAGLLLAIPLSVYTSRVRIGRALRSHGLMLTPEEGREPRVLREARDAGAMVAERLATLRAAIADRGTQRRVISALPAELGAERGQGRGRSGAHRAGAARRAASARRRRGPASPLEPLCAGRDAPRSRRRSRSPRLVTGSRRGRRPRRRADSADARLARMRTMP